MKTLIFLLAFASSVFAGTAPVPGATNPAVTQENIDETICVSGFTKEIRPPAADTNKVKRTLYARLPAQARAMHPIEDFELDHLIPLVVGGNPGIVYTRGRVDVTQSIALGNLWLQPRFGEHDAAEKDICEVATRRRVCDLHITLDTAQRGIAADWLSFCTKVIR